MLKLCCLFLQVFGERISSNLLLTSFIPNLLLTSFIPFIVFSFLIIKRICTWKLSSQNMHSELISYNSSTIDWLVLKKWNRLHFKVFMKHVLVILQFGQNSLTEVGAIKKLHERIAWLLNERVRNSLFIARWTCQTTNVVLFCSLSVYGRSLLN